MIKLSSSRKREVKSHIKSYRGVVSNLKGKNEGDSVIDMMHDNVDDVIKTLFASCTIFMHSPSSVISDAKHKVNYIYGIPLACRYVSLFSVILFL
jgi:hypothetical protein